MPASLGGKKINQGKSPPRLAERRKEGKKERESTSSSKPEEKEEGEAWAKRGRRVIWGRKKERTIALRLEGGEEKTGREKKGATEWRGPIMTKERKGGGHFPILKGRKNRRNRKKGDR